jgi:hypothetical protein
MVLVFSRKTRSGAALGKIFIEEIDECDLFRPIPARAGPAR